jgi:hypothetical protein
VTTPPRPKSKLPFGMQSKPTVWVAVVFVVVGLAGIYLGRHDKLREWAPNVAVTAFALAITITIVERIVRSEERARVRPRVEYTIFWIGLGFRDITREVAMDYACTHRANFHEIPADASQMFKLWLTALNKEDQPRTLHDGARLPPLLLRAQEFASGLERARERDVDVLDTDLVLEIDEFLQRIDTATVAYARTEQDPANRAQIERLALSMCVEAALKFATTFGRYLGVWLTILPVVKDTAREVSQRPI